MSGYFIAVNKITGKILTHGQSIYGYRDSARRGIGQFVRDKAERASYVIIEITAADVLRLLTEKMGE